MPRANGKSVKTVKRNTDREDFLKRLEMVQYGLSKKERIEQSTAFVFLEGEVITFNEEMMCRCDSGLTNPITGAVDGKPLLEILRKLPDIMIDVEQAESHLVLKGKNKRDRVRMHAEVLLKYDVVERPEDWEKLDPEFLQAIDHVAKCVGQDEMQFERTCVHVHPKWVEARNDCEMTRYRLKTGFPESVLLRGDAVKHIVPLGAKEYAVTDSWAHFRGDDITVSCRRYVLDYPDMSEHLGVEGGSPFPLPKALIEIVDRASVFSIDNIDDNLLEVDVEPGKLTVTGRGLKGDHVEWRAVKYDGPKVQFLISPELLSQLAKSYNDCVLTHDRMKVTGEKWVYVTALGQPDKPRENGKE